MTKVLPVWICDECLLMKVTAEKPEHEHELEQVGWFEEK